MGENTRLLIVGGVAGGAAAAARARRLSEDAEIIMFERGKHVSFANCGLPYHIGGTIEERKRLLVQTPKSLHRRFRIDVRVNTEVIGIDRPNREVVAVERKA
ncbi:MAG: FAD-dependent oxidoreductase, partial [Thermoguttaceae bacterium]